MPDNIADFAERHGFSPDAVRAAAEALRRGGGGMAQFNHPELGGMGQWAAGGMIMIGDMFNNGLKARVDALCRDLAASPGPVSAAAEQQPNQTSHWWPGDLGTPSATGAQNDITLARAISGPHTLAVGLAWWSVGMVLAVGYMVFVYSRFSGKADVEAGH